MKKIISAKLFILILLFQLFIACSEIPEQYLLDRPEDISKSAIVYHAGDVQTFTFEETSFSLIYAPGGFTFPIFEGDSISATVASSFWIGESEVSYSLWKSVYTWASGDLNMNGVIDGDEIQGMYLFANTGEDGGGVTEFWEFDEHPVTNISWRDSIVWCNALTEWVNFYNSTNLVCVYKNGTSPIRDSNSIICDAAAITYGATGFRLPSSGEWELAARWKGKINSNGALEKPAASGCFWTPGAYASGADADTTNSISTQEVAWYEQTSTNSIMLKRPNLLGIYDMSGNVGEWCFTSSSVLRYVMGGGWNSAASKVSIGSPEFKQTKGINLWVGFRIARSAD